MSAGRHVAFGGFGLGDVYDGVEEVGFAMLAAEVLIGASVSTKSYIGGMEMVRGS